MQAAASDDLQGEPDNDDGDAHNAYKKQRKPIPAQTLSTWTNPDCEEPNQGLAG